MDAKVQSKPLNLQQVAEQSSLIKQIQQQLEGTEPACKLWTQQFEASSKEGKEVN